MSIELSRPIRAELVARKIEQIQNFQHPEVWQEMQDDPRLVEILWFLQWVSLPRNYAGGLSRFCEDFMADCLVEIGTKHLVEFGKQERYSIAQAQRIFDDLPEQICNQLTQSSYNAFDVRWLLDGDSASEIEVERAQHLACVDETLARLSWGMIHEICVEQTKEKLTAFLTKFCEEPSQCFRKWGTKEGRFGGVITCAHAWYFHNVIDSLLAFMERRKAALAAQLGETEVTKLVMRWMSKSSNTGRAVMIVGNSRFGKTEAVKLFCAMHPGRARLINTPATNAMNDLLREVAKSLGMEPGAHSPARLREEIEYVLRFSRLLFCFDEFQLLLPVSFSKNTAPSRLNWVRRAVMDAGIAAIFVCTPQTEKAKHRFVRATGFAMEQFDERILKTVLLPETLSETDLTAVARIHFPGLAEAYLKYVVKLTSATERNYLSDLEKIATLAKDNAREEGRSLPTLDDIKAAIADVLPVAKTPAPKPVEVEEIPPVFSPKPRGVQPGFSASAHAMQRQENCRGTNLLDQEIELKNRSESVVLT